MVQVIKVPDTAPVVRGVVTPPSAPDEVTSVALAETPASSARVVHVVMPQGGTPPGGETVDPEFKARVEGDLAALDGRLDILETAPPLAPSGPAGGDLAGSYPSPTLARSYAESAPTAAALASKAPRPTVRKVATSTTAQVGEFLEVTTGASQITIASPPGLTGGDEITIVKVDGGSGRVVFNDDTNSDATAVIVGQWSGATLTYTGPNWVVRSVSVSYSAHPVDTDGGTGGMTREQADQRYDPIGAATAAVAGVTKQSLGLGAVENVAPLDMPVSGPQAAAFATKAPLVTPHHQAGSGNVTLDARNGPVQALSATGNVVLVPPSNPSDQQSLRLEVFGSGGSRSVTILSGISNASGQPLPFTVPQGRFAILGLVYSARAGRWMLLSYTVEPGS